MKHMPANVTSFMCKSNMVLKALCQLYHGLYGIMILADICIVKDQLP